MSVIRMSFNETLINGNRAWRDAIGFLNRISFEYNASTVIIKKGSLVYGFKQGGNPAHGWYVDNDEIHSIVNTATDIIFYITMDVNGFIRVEPNSNFTSVIGIGANIPGIPWYTLPVSGSYPVRALIGKVFKKHGLITGYVVCDDPFWCEFEGEF